MYTGMLLLLQMPGNCHFQDNWLSDDKFSAWVRRAPTSLKAHCRVCKRDFDISTMGRTALTSHAKGDKHQAKLAKESELVSETCDIASYMGPKPSTSTSGSNPSSSRVGDMKSYTHINDQLHAETIWGLKMVSSNYSFSSCNNLSYALKTMFPDSNIAQSFTMSETKAN